MSVEIEQQIQASISRNNQEMLASMGQIIDEKIGGLKRSSEQQLEAIKKLKVDVPEIKRKANKDQFMHNAKVLDCFSNAITSLQKGEPQDTIANLEEGKKLIEGRQKLILVADKSPFGWLTVENYKSNALASDEEDEKRLIRAENKASAEAKRRASKARRNINGGIKWPQSSTVSPSPVNLNYGYRKGSCLSFLVMLIMNNYL